MPYGNLTSFSKDVSRRLVVVFGPLLFVSIFCLKSLVFSILAFLIFDECIAPFGHFYAKVGLPRCFGSRFSCSLKSCKISDFCGERFYSVIYKVFCTFVHVHVKHML